MTNRRSNDPKKPQAQLRPRANNKKRTKDVEPALPPTTFHPSARLAASLAVSADYGSTQALPVMCCPAHLVRRDQFDEAFEAPLTPLSATAVVMSGGDRLKEHVAHEAPAMNLAAATTAISGAFDLQAEALLDTAIGAGTPIAAGTAADASYDFDEYIFLRDVDDPYTNPRPINSNMQIPQDPRMDRFERAVRKTIGEFVRIVADDFSQLSGTPVGPLSRFRLEGILYSQWRAACLLRAYNRLTEFSPTAIRAKRIAARTNLSPEDFYGYGLLLRMWDAKVMGLIYFQSSEVEDALGPLLTREFWEDASADVFESYFENLSADPALALDQDYPFDPYPSDEIFLGLQVVHRQTWRLLGYGRGELVKSIPLAPRETQKISVKVNTRTKSARTSEEASSFETSSESSTSSKDTAEIVSEASEKLNMHAEAEVSGGYGPFIQAKVSGGIAQDLASSSKQTKNRLNEVMQKTAGRMKRDSKVVINTERETGYEVTRASEIVNPNDEVPVTYLYHRLQQKYWVSTGISEVHSVVFVPERLPDPNEIDERWIAHHADTLSGALLDLGFSGILNTLRKEPTSMPAGTTSVFERAANTAINATQDFRNYTGQGTMPDFLQSGQQYFQQEQERTRTAAMDAARRLHQAQALIQHIRRHILHYMRAIWASEDYDQRMQRYSRMRVATDWYFVPYYAQSTPTPNPLQVEGFFVPSTGSARPLTEVIDPIGPIGYLFNCAIYRLRDDARIANAHQALAYLRSAYTRFGVRCAFSAGAGVAFRYAVAHRPTSFSSDVTVIYKRNRGIWLLPIPQRAENDWLPVSSGSGIVDVSGVRIWLDGTPVDNAEMIVSLRVTDELEDPQVRFAKLQSPLPVTADEAIVFSDNVLRRMADTLPEIRRMIAGQYSWASLNAQQKDAVRSRYHEWIVLRDSGRLVTVDTDNVVLDLEVGATPIMEPFKRLHRYLDVLKERESLLKAALENRRRQALLDNGVLGDPDIENVSVVSTDPELAKLISTTAPR